MRSIRGVASGVGARASGAFDALPIRTRLAAVSALLTFAILCAFALVVGFLTGQRLRSDFRRDVAQNADQVAAGMHLYVDPTSGQIVSTQPSLRELASPSDGVIKIFTAAGAPLEQWPRNAPDFGSVPLGLRHGTQVISATRGYEVVTVPAGVLNPLTLSGFGRIYIQYARPLEEVNGAVARVDLFLLLGVMAGTGLALLAGTMIARRAMAPIAELTSAAATVARTRDRSLAMPEISAEDEVGELAKTLSGMLRELDAAHAETEQTLQRQRQFVADASHELRTPLTSVLANLELLTERGGAGGLDGDLADAARSALRSSRRMRRLVADLLLLARNDVRRTMAHDRVDLAAVVVDAAAELEPLNSDHRLSVDVKSAFVEGSRDELERAVINLIENAFRHTPAGSQVWIGTGVDAAGRAFIDVQDDGPGIPDNLAETLFERFVRGAGDRGGSFGLGLAIVRSVALAHGGSVQVSRAEAHPSECNDRRGGARFRIMLPSLAVPPGAASPPIPAGSARTDQLNGEGAPSLPARPHAREGEHAPPTPPAAGSAAAAVSAMNGRSRSDELHAGGAKATGKRH